MGLIGVVIGGILGAAVQFGTARLQGKREREARLFDHKRSAYLDFMIVERRLHDYCFHYDREAVKSRPEPNENDVEMLRSTFLQIELFGSERSIKAALNLEMAMISWVLSLEGNVGGTWGGHYSRVVEAERSYKSEVRADLGLVEDLRSTTNESSGGV
jgi:hypothetical protein